MLPICTFTPLNTRQVFQLVFPSFCNALRAYLYLWQLKTQLCKSF